MILYHYCSQQAFLEILKNKKIWLSGAHNMSDYMEGVWAENIMGEVLKSFIEKYDEEVIRTFIERYHHSKFSPFICCFSSNGDLLSQWRAYAEDGCGFAIGFESDYFKLSNDLPCMAFNDKTKLTLNKIEYDVERQKTTVSTFMESALDYVQAELRSTQLPITLIRGLDGLAGYAALAKNPAFSEEQEYRLVHMPMIIASKITNKTTDTVFACSEMKYRTSNNRIIPYFEYDFSQLMDKGSIVEIIAGPKNQTTDMDLRMLTGSSGYEATKIKRSSASYR
ncbi:DUF2971 domain-containing protein [Eoetvoesiella caeni]